MILRLYVSQLAAIWPAFLARPRRAAISGFALTLKSETPEEIAQAIALRDQVVGAGLECIIGFRTSERFTHPANWCEASLWTEIAQTAQRLRAANLSEIHLDLEAYGLSTYKVPSTAMLSAIGRTVAQLRAAMAPLLYALDEFDRVIVYPASVEDEAVAAVAEGAGEIELWREHFGMETLTARDPHAAEHRALVMSERRAALSRRFPRALVREGVYDSALRASGEDLRARWLDAMGPAEPWAFLLRREDETEIGSESWYRSVAIGAANDVTRAWTFGSAGSGRISQIGATAISILGMPAPSTVLSSRGRRLEGQYLRASRVLGPIYSIVFDGIAAMGPIVGESQPGADSWCLMRGPDGLVLRVRGVAPGAPQVVYPCGAFADGRVVVVRDGATFTISHAGGTTIVNPGTVRAGAGHMYVGAASTESLSSAVPPMLAPGIVVGAVEVFERALSTAEIAAVVAQPYPRG